MKSTWSTLILTGAGLLIAGTGTALAGLSAVDPGPYTTATGRFPLWYQDENGLALELCRSKAVSSRTNTNMCMYENEPGVFDDRFPMIFPDNWPGELFWMLAEAEIPEGAIDGYELETYVAGVEAAFGQDRPIDGEQISFARIRVRATIPIPGEYTITHPYGVEVITVTAADIADRGGRRAINMTRDLGIGGPGDFTGVLDADVGPFLQSSNGPYTEINPETGEAERFVGDPGLPEEVTGSPHDTNLVRIEGPAGIIETRLFTLFGKILDERPPTPVEVERASYRRTAEGLGVEVFASSTNTASLCYRDTLELVGSPPSPCRAALLADNNGRFFAHDRGLPVPPALLVVTASDPLGVTRPTSVSRRLTDIVKITAARYSWEDNTLRIEAVSSDEVAVPDLAAAGFGRLSKSGLLQTLTIPGLSQPPAWVTVKSAAGGADTEPVLVTGTAPAPTENRPPIAVDDSDSTSVGVPVTIAVLLNDHDPDNDTPLTIAELTSPVLGSAVLNGTTAIVYTPPATEVPLTDSFSYRIRDARGALSEPATVTVGVSPNQPPLAQDDEAATLGVSLPIDVLANDSDPEGNTPLAIVNLTQPAAGQGSTSLDNGMVRYNPPDNIAAPFTASFGYQAADSLGATSAPATVRVSVSPPPAVAENLTVNSAEVRVRSNNRFRWQLDGTTSITTGNTISIFVATTAGELLLGTAEVRPNGRWRFSANTTGAAPASPAMARVSSSFGNSMQVTLGSR